MGKGPGMFEYDSFYEDFDMDEVDTISIENYEQLFGNTLNNAEALMGSGGMDSLFATEETSAVDSTCHVAVVAEVRTPLPLQNNIFLLS